MTEPTELAVYVEVPIRTGKSPVAFDEALFEVQYKSRVDEHGDTHWERERVRVKHYPADFVQKNNLFSPDLSLGKYVVAMADVELEFKLMEHFAS